MHIIFVARLSERFQETSHGYRFVRVEVMVLHLRRAPFGVRRDFSHDLSVVPCKRLPQTVSPVVQGLLEGIFNRL